MDGTPNTVGLAMPRRRSWRRVRDHHAFQHSRPDGGPFRVDCKALSDQAVHPLIVVAVFLALHPFQDGNG
jgi:hypothetical protein